MAAMPAVGTGHRVSAHANMREAGREYVIELDISRFLESELAIDAIGSRITVRGHHAEEQNDEAVAFLLQERLEESFRLPDDADPELIEAFYAHGALELHVPRVDLVPHRVPIRHRSPYECNPNAQPC